MILRRIALFAALLFGLFATQLPAFVAQYRQRLGGAIDELAAEVARFEADSAQQGLTAGAGIDRLRANKDELARARGVAIADDSARLQRLRDADAAFREAGPVARLATVLTHPDGRLISGTARDFQPAVPTTPEAFVLGVIGFTIGGGIVHIAGRPLRNRRREARAA